MNNPFQEQLLKIGLVNKQQVKKANQDKYNQQKKRTGKKHAEHDEALSKARQAAAHKAERDRALNRQKQEQAHKKALSIEINQLIKAHQVKRDERCEIAYNFEHRNKVNRLYVNAEMKQQLIQGKLGIARIEGHYELVPLSIAEKIKQRNEKRIILMSEEATQPDENDPYAKYQIPDDITW